MSVYVWGFLRNGIDAWLGAKFAFHPIDLSGDVVIRGGSREVPTLA